MEELVAITPVNFFQLSLSCHYLEPKKGFPNFQGRNRRRYTLPDSSPLCDERPFAELAMGWNPEGIEFFLIVDQPMERVSYPNLIRGDSLELFIDTRDVKTSGYNTRFCHHFFFLPEAVEGRVAGEITHFRTAEAHELCDPAELKMKADIRRNSYHLHAWIPRECLYGYDPEQFDRLGFSYRVNRPYLPPQHFSVVTQDYQMEQQPSLWSSVRLIE